MADLAVFQRFSLEGIHISQTDLNIDSYTVDLELEYRGLKCAGKKLHNSGHEVEIRQVAQKYLEECELLSQIRHPNIVQFFGICFEKGSDFPILVMEYLPTNLANCLNRYGILPNETSYSILHDVSLGIAYLHGQSPPIIHRDLSANSVLLSANMTAKISDLGVARILNLTPLQMIQMTETLGTYGPAYMPPEVMVHEPQYDSSVDVFSFGVMMIHIFTAEWPLPKDNLSSSDSVNEDKLTPMTEVKRYEEDIQKISHDHPLTDLIICCLKNNPLERPQAKEIVKKMRIAVLQFPSSFANKIEMLQHISALSLQKKQLAQKKLKPALEIAFSTRIKQLQLENEALGFELEMNQTELESYKSQWEDLSTEVEGQIKNIAIFRDELARINDLETELVSTKATKKSQEEQEKVNTQAKEAEIIRKDFIVSAKGDSLVQCKSDMKDLNEQLQEIWKFLSQQPQSLQVQLSHSFCPETPVKMHSGKAIAIEGFVYYGGGFCDKDDSNYNIYCYNTFKDLWSTLPKLPVQHFSIGEAKGQLVIVGGVNEVFSPTKKILVFSSKKTWKQTIPPMPTARGTPAVVSLPDHLVVAGGYIESPTSSTDVVEIYSSSTNQWYKTNKLPFAQSMLQTGVCNNNNTMYLIGAWNKNNVSNITVTAEVDKLISNSIPANQEVVQAPTNNSVWKHMDNLPNKKCSVVTALDKVLIVGGAIKHEDTLTHDQKIYVYSTSMNKWFYAGDLPFPVVKPATASLSPTEFFVIGGSDNSKNPLPTMHKITVSLKIL